MLLLMTFSLAACTGGIGRGITDVSESTEATTEWNAKAEWNYITKKHAMTVGYIPSEPMNYTDKKGVLMGFDSELVRIVCSRLGLNVVFMEVDKASALKKLESKEIDCVWGGFTISGKAPDGLAVTKGYMTNLPVVVVAKDDAKKFTSLSSLKSATLTAAEGSDIEKLVKTKKLSSSYTPSASEKDALQSVLDGKADVAVVGSVTANYLVSTDKAFSGLAILGGDKMTLGNGAYYAAAFRKSGTIEAEKINAVLDKLADEGVLSDLAEKYGLTGCLSLS